MSLTFLATPPKCRLEDLVFPEETSRAIAELLEDQEFHEALLEAGLPARSRLILYGPPGCGKTSVAHALAGKLGMKFICISMAETVGSHMGESEKNIEQAFRYGSQNRCVMLLDEFDSIGTQRQEAAQSADLCNNRTVNAVLTCLENHRPLGLLVACTNFFEMLDPAIKRRFDLTLEVPAASRQALRKIAESVIQGRYGIRVEDILAEAATPAAVVRVAQDRLRRVVIEKEKQRRAQIPLFDLSAECKKLEEKLASPVKEATDA